MASRKLNLIIHIIMSHKTAILMNRVIFKDKMSSGFPSDVLPLLCVSAAFYLVELSPAATRCCSFCLQAAYMLLSGTSVNHRVEAEQSKDIRGKTKGLFLRKIWPGSTKTAVFVRHINMHLLVLFFEAEGHGQSYVLLL